MVAFPTKIQILVHFRVNTPVTFPESGSRKRFHTSEIRVITCVSMFTKSVIFRFRLEKVISRVILLWKTRIWPYFSRTTPRNMSFWRSSLFEKRSFGGKCLTFYSQKAFWMRFFATIMKRLVPRSFFGVAIFLAIYIDRDMTVFVKTSKKDHFHKNVYNF